MAAETIELRATSPRAMELVARSPTLEGNVPLRAARACPPLLAGNALGWSLRARAPLRVTRGFRSVHVEPPIVRARALDRATVELALDPGFRLEHAIGGVGLVVERPRNLRDRRVDVVPTRADRGDFELVLRVRLARGEEPITLAGALAHVTPFVLEPRVRAIDVARVPELARAHAAFFDARYFAEKRRGPTRKYKLAGDDRAPTLPDLDGVLVAHAGGAPATIDEDELGALRVTIRAELATSLVYEGLRVEPRLDARALERRARSIEEALARALGDGELGDGALRYFTTYVTPHAPGDPHVFWKPSTLVATSEELEAVVDGPTVPGLEGLRGVVASHAFHAVPAVGEMIAPRAYVAAGTTLAVVRFTPRDRLALVRR